MEFFGIGLVSFCCIMFIHLGLGETFCKLLHFDFILFRCQKCLNFWATLAYALFFTNLPILFCLSLSFGLSYLALWIDLGLAKMAERYDYWYEKTNENMGEQQNEQDY